MKDVITIATVTFNAKWGDKNGNINRISGYIESASKRGANLIVFPEMALTGYDDEEEKAKPDKMQTKLAETIPGESSNTIGELTKKFGVYAVFGMPERDANDPTTIYNSVAICGPEGVIGSYRKMHLPYPEPHWATRGNKPCLFDTPWGPIGLSICYDSYCFPEVIRYEGAKGARLHINCTAYAKCHGKQQARTCLEAHVLQDNMFIVSSNLGGIDLFNDFYGGSSIMGPSRNLVEVHYYAGYPIGDLNANEEEMYMATVDLGLANRFIFEPNPLIDGATDFRPALYKEWCEDLLKDDKFKE